MIKYIYFILFFFSLYANAQKDVSNDTIYVINRDSQLRIQHIVEKENTVYSLSKKYNLSLDSLIEVLNLENNLILRLGDTLLIPISGASLSASRNSSDDIAVLYRVKQKDNLFRIARMYLKLREEQIMVMNQMENTNLSIGQELLLGYLTQKDISKGTMVEFDQSLDMANQVPDSLSSAIMSSEKIPDDKQKIYQEKNGVVLWFADTDYNSGRFIMHETAPVNSVIAVTNPMFGKTVYAKVVGNIPPNTYPKEVIAIISPMVAKELGALDKRFFGKIKYEVSGL